MRKAFVCILIAAFLASFTTVNAEEGEYMINYRVTASTLNVRFGPGIEFDSFYVLTRGEEVLGKEPVDNWAEINCYGYKGYVYSNYICDTSQQSAYGNMEYLGCYRITGYCPYCFHCCGKTDGVTASGKNAVIGETVAMAGMPFGTRVYISGMGFYTVHDRGVGYGVVDIACSSDAACYSVTGYRDVYIVH